MAGLTVLGTVGLLIFAIILFIAFGAIVVTVFILPIVSKLNVMQC